MDPWWTALFALQVGLLGFQVGQGAVVGQILWAGLWVVVCGHYAYKPRNG